MLVGDVRCATTAEGVLLKVIGRQPMILRADKCLEERPGFPGELPEKDRLLSREPCFAAAEWPADPPYDGGRGKPEAQEGQRHN